MVKELRETEMSQMPLLLKDQKFLNLSLFLKPVSLEKILTATRRKKAVYFPTDVEVNLKIKQSVDKWA